MASCIPIMGLVLSLAVIAGYICATATDHWIEVPLVSTSAGLWRQCTNYAGVINMCSDLGDVPAYMHISRGCMIAACIVALLAIILAIVGFIQEIGNTKIKIAGVLIILTASAVATATIWYAIEKATYYDDLNLDYDFGYSIIIGWVSVPLAIVAGSMLLATYSRH
ncbi:claudin-like protein isoform X1 [Saccoglossus kowalevskii]|uniref:Claudin-like protein n=1 Tax=Saccoglossus kowalevskii TaxID=10224 RepID=D1LWY7_SACKO|nr:claudin-like protein precursor [Saccoglossus kowalevskii]XP_006819324.1 PREDICTED: claudin-like protein isoform X1 [Saccoglossus kowalevskii]ACY92493.1 claudin-like protein [Saccoglossus kowalevskii]